MNLSRRHLLATIGLALPAVTVLATEAKATTDSHKKHKKSGHSTQASHKHHTKPATPSATQG